MALKLEDKKAIVEEVAKIAATSVSAVATENLGLTVANMTELRKNARKSNVEIRVIKNTLARKAFQGTEFECLSDKLTGPIFIAFSHEDPGAAARIIRAFLKDNEEKAKVRALAINGQLLGAEKLEAIASLPTKEQAIAMLMSVMKAPITQLVRTLAEPTAQVVRALAAVSKKS